MKRLTAIIIILSLLLCGCSQAAAPAQTQPQNGAEATTQPQQEENKNLFEQIADGVGEMFSDEKKALTEIGDGVREESSFVLYITINPEFEIFLDGNACISKIRCINEDAQILFTELDVMGKSYDEGIPLILDAACDQGYLNEQNSEITIETTVLEPLPEEYLEEALPEVAYAFESVVEQYAADNDLSITVDAPEPEYDGPKVTLEDLGIDVGKPNSENSYELYDENDNVIGSCTEYYDENGILSKRVTQWDDGTVATTEYAPNGVAILETQDGPNGHSETHYDEDGNKIKFISNRSDGSKSETTFYPNGNDSNLGGMNMNVESMIVNNSDGSCLEEYYREDGTLISSYQKNADGSIYESRTNDDGSRVQTSDDATGHYEWHYFADGTTSKYIEDSGQGYHEKTYYANGQVATDLGRRGDEYGERRWNESGTLTYHYSKTGTSEFLFENYVLVYYIDENGEKITDREQLDMMATAMGMYN